MPFFLHRIYIIYGVLYIYNVCVECELVRCLVYCSAVSCMNKSLFLVCKLVLYFVHAIIKPLNRSMVKNAKNFMKFRNYYKAVSSIEPTKNSAV